MCLSVLATSVQSQIGGWQCVCEARKPSLLTDLPIRQEELNCCLKPVVSLGNPYGMACSNTGNSFRFILQTQAIWGIPCLIWSSQTFFHSDLAMLYPGSLSRGSSEGKRYDIIFLFEVFVVGDTGTLAICWQWNREEVEGPLLILITDQTFNRHYVLATAQLKYIFILPFPQYITNPYSYEICGGLQILCVLNDMSNMYIWLVR